MKIYISVAMTNDDGTEKRRAHDIEQRLAPLADVYNPFCKTEFNRDVALNDFARVSVSDLVVVLWSKAAHRGSGVLMEAGAAVSRGIPIVVLTDPAREVKVPKFLAAVALCIVHDEVLTPVVVGRHVSDRKWFLGRRRTR